MDTVVHYFGKHYHKQENLGESNIKSILSNFVDSPYVTIVVFNSDRPSLYSYPNNIPEKYTEYTDTTETCIVILGKKLFSKTIKFEKSYASNDLFYTQLQYKIYYSQDIKYSAPENSKSFSYLTNNGTGCIPLLIETSMTTDAPIPNAKNKIPSRIEAFEIIPMTLDDKIFTVEK